MTESEAYRFFKEAIASFDDLMANPFPGFLTWNIAVANAANLVVRNCEIWRKTWKGQEGGLTHV